MSKKIFIGSLLAKIVTAIPQVKPTVTACGM